MNPYTLSHVHDDVLLRDLRSRVAQERMMTANVLALIAEVDVRRLYVPAGYSSMFAYCLEELRFSEDSAYKRIRAARAARQFPILFDAVAEGRLHLAAVYLLASHLTAENVAELIESATHRRKSEVEEMLARRFPGAAPAIARIVPAVSPRPERQLAPGPVRNDRANEMVAYGDPLLGDGCPSGSLRVRGLSLPPERDRHEFVAGPLAPERVGGMPAVPAAPRFLVQVTIDKSTHDKLRYAQALLSHTIPSGDVAQVLDRALDALIAHIERRKLGARRPESVGKRNAALPRRTSVRKHYVPAPVRRAVWERDQGRCTFVSASGHRCNERRFLQFDHVEPVARGGSATVEGMRLRCRAHNQLEAERVFGAGFMAMKREEARPAARARAAQAEACTNGATPRREHTAAPEATPGGIPHASA